MFESAVCDGPQQFTLEQEISEASCMDADIGTFGLAGTCYGRVALLDSAIGGCCGWRLGGLEFLVGVIDEIFFGRHVDDDLMFVRVG